MEAVLFLFWMVISAVCTAIIVVGLCCFVGMAAAFYKVYCKSPNRKSCPHYNQCCNDGRTWMCCDCDGVVN